MKFTLPASIERQQTSSVRFSIGKTTKYNRECAAEANGAAIGAQKREKIYTESALKELILADLTGRSPPSTLRLTDLQYFLKRGE